MARYRFDRWEVDGEVITGQPLSLTIMADTTVVAVYRELLGFLDIHVYYGGVEQVATVQVAGQILNAPTDFPISLTPGIYRIYVPFFDVSQDAIIVDGQTTTVNFDISLPRRSITLQSVPIAVQITVDGQIVEPGDVIEVDEGTQVTINVPPEVEV